MKNAEMEIIRFDAQDVITTSNTGGGSVTAWFTLTQGMVPDSQIFNVHDYNNADWTVVPRYVYYLTMYGTDGEPLEATNGGTYLLNSSTVTYTKSGSFDGSDSAVYIYGVTIGQDGEERESLADVVGWLVDNATPHTH